MRHATSAHHATVAASANPSIHGENDGTKPGASLATLAAGLAGMPVCVEIQITQIASAEMEKNSSVNQSISAETLRLSVGRANAASVASAGKLSSKLRSDAEVLKAEPIASSANHSGSSRWRCIWRLVMCLRQRHSVHSASGQLGQVNHSNRRLKLPQCCGSAYGQTTRQRHTLTCQASAAVASAASSKPQPARRKKCVAISPLMAPGLVPHQQSAAPPTL